MDAVLLAGDIGYGRQEHASTLDYATELAALLMCPVVVVPGNHEYYRGSFVEDRAALIDARCPDLHVLDRGAVSLPLRDGQKGYAREKTGWTGPGSIEI